LTRPGEKLLLTLGAFDERLFAGRKARASNGQVRHDFRMTFKKRPQFSLKTLLLVVTGLCVLAAFAAGCPEIAAPTLLIFCITTAPGYCFGVAIDSLVRSRISRTPPRSPNGRFQARIAALIPRRLPIIPVSAATACTLLCAALPLSDIGPFLLGITIIFVGASIFGAMFPGRLQKPYRRLSPQFAHYCSCDLNLRLRGQEQWRSHSLLQRFPYWESRTERVIAEPFLSAAQFRLWGAFSY